jgi:hypothetical protein
VELLKHFNPSMLKIVGEVNSEIKQLHEELVEVQKLRPSSEDQSTKATEVGEDGAP